jgi:2-C-methyl-D-erythritol 2,4-cyclodiphosphate synthase
MDAHRLGSEPPVLLGGVAVDHLRGVVATSDGDVVAHAVADALLGATASGDIGQHFPSNDPRWEGVDSMVLLGKVVRMVRARGGQPSFCDVTVVAESVRVSPHRLPIRKSLSETLGLEMGEVSVKATTTDGMGWLGSDQGIAAMAVVGVVL